MRMVKAGELFVEFAAISLLAIGHAVAASTGQVRTADNKPVARAVVTILNGGDNQNAAYASLQGTELKDTSGRSVSTSTDDLGNFQLPDHKPGALLVVTGPAGFAAMLADDLVQRSVITVEAWGSIDGVWLNHGRPMKAKRIMPGYSGVAGHWITGAELKTDENGHFSSAAVPPGTISINWLAPPPSFTGGSLYLELAKETVGPGQTAAVHIVTDGRAVTGRLVSGANVEEISSLAGWVVTLNPDIPGPPKQPKEVDTPEAMMKWFDDWKGTKDGAEYVAAQRKTRQACVGEGGSLEMEAVVPGKYLLRGYVFGPTGLAANVETVKIEVPDGENAYDIGAIHYQPKKNLKVGDEAPPFQVGTLDGGSVSLSDFRGKYVLLDFWAVWCGACVAEMANLKEVYDAFHGDPRFVMLSLSLDEDIAVPKKFAQQRGTSVWPQAFLGPWGKDKVHQGYDVYGIPQILLIGPDGRIIATGLRGGSIKTSIGKALGQPAAN